MTEIERCRVEQAEAMANSLAAPDSFVAKLGAEDWLKEELEIMHCLKPPTLFDLEDH